MGYTSIATWDFSYNGTVSADALLRQGADCCAAAQEVCRVTEDDPDIDCVGSGSFPNEMGEVELDAAIMRGKDLGLGCVCAVQGVKNPVLLARAVMDHTWHTLLAARGAEDFAAEHNIPRGILYTDKSTKSWLEYDKPAPEGHDTVCAVVLDDNGDIAVATSTAGLKMKHRGRVGDSPLIGCGFYVDNEVGGAAATGKGEDIMRGCTSFYAVMLMSQGCSPAEAAKKAITRTHEMISRTGAEVGDMAMVCVNKRGEYGAYANHNRFIYTLAKDGMQPLKVQSDYLDPDNG